MGIPFETNVSVPQGDERKGVVTQFFLRDPDGYYVELCNCDILTDFCLGTSKVYIEGYEESCMQSVNINQLGKMIVHAEEAKRRLAIEESNNEVLEHFDSVDGSTVVVDDEKLANLLKRTKIYGDVVQGEDEQSLREILKKTNNHMPDAIKYIKAKHGSHQTFQPPTIYKNNEEAYKPPTLHIEK